MGIMATSVGVVLASRTPWVQEWMMATTTITTTAATNAGQAWEKQGGRGRGEILLSSS